MDNSHERKVVLYLAESLDGFIAEKNGDTSWLPGLEATEIDAAYQAFYHSIDTIIMGRKTYQQAVSLAGVYPYQDKQGFVFSTTLHDTSDPTTVVAGDLVGFVKKLKKEGGKNIWLAGGADLATTLLENQLIDEIIINIAPTLLGDGISLVNEKVDDIALNLKSVKQIGQLVELRYEVLK